jgi:hypothetical protein
VQWQNLDMHIKSVNGLMQQKAISIMSVKVEGWLATVTLCDEQHLYLIK